MGLAVLLLAAFLVARTGSNVEGFDADTLKAQRQQLQMEGERRYNPMARLQSPGQKIPAADVDAAITTERAAPSIGHPSRASLLGLIGTSLGIGAADDGSGKVGEWVEQTGVVQDKINFCESLTTINCDLLASDPRMRECGFCHRDGTNSKGKAHRGGLYISSDDQIRANLEAEGGAASYQPTIGTCKPMNFTLMPTNCQAREAQLQCQSAGAPTSSNPCAQCYGKTPNNATGLLYFNPNKPVRHQVFLNVSHTGFYTGPNGYGLEVTYPNGAIVGLPAAPVPSGALSPPQQAIALNLAEGDIIKLTIYGPPTVFCGWLSNQSGTRTVSLDIGVQAMTPEGAFEIAGDKNSSMVTSNITGSAPTDFMSSVPNTVLWYLRRNNVMLQSVTRAYYGMMGSASADVTQAIQSALAANKNITVGTGLLNSNQADPAPGQTKTLMLDYDVLMTGAQFTDGQSVNASSLNTKVTFTFQMPATLADPPLAADLADCPTGPLVTTEVGAGLMGSHSCFKTDGSFNPTAYCLQELFTAAGGTQQGTDWPATDAAAAKLVAPSGTLDDTVAALNRLGNIAVYGVDMNGAMVDFPTFKDAALRMLGIAVKNPCDGPMSGTGPHSPECLDYLWRTMNNPAQDATPITGSPPYSGCTAAGLGAPLNPDGSVNGPNVAAANAQGGVTSVRSYYQGLYNRTQNSANFDAQVAAMRDCYGTNIQPPVTPSGTCPPPAPNEFLCFTPDMVQPPEVFAVCPNNNYTVAFKDAESTCASYGARLASPGEIATAQQNNAQWCSCGWANDGNAYYPMQQSGIPGCGAAGMNSCGAMDSEWNWNPGKGCVTCYGVKPPAGTTDVKPYSDVMNMWSASQTIVEMAGISQQSIPACRIVSSQGVQCVSTDGQNPLMFPSVSECTSFIGSPAGKQTSPPVSKALSDVVTQYITSRV